MEIQFSRPSRDFRSLFTAFFLSAILCNIFATLRWLPLLPFGLIGVALPLIPPVRRRKVRLGLWIILALWLVIRFFPILNGTKLLANRIFELSQQSQSYEYEYFAITHGSALEAVLWLSFLAGALCALWGNKVNGILCGLWVLAMAYFGITPGIFWLALLVITAFLNVLPKKRRWFYGLTAAVLVAAIALGAMAIAPDPLKAVSTLDEQLRDILAASPLTYEQTPVPSDVPEPEPVPQPETELQQPDHGVQKAARNVLFIVLVALTLTLLFLPAIVKDRAEKQSRKARAGFDDPDNAAAIRAMYLYARRWRTLSDSSGTIPEEIYAIWQEAAYSDHGMTDAQRERVRVYMEETAQSVWNTADRRMRLRIRYRICL